MRHKTIQKKLILYLDGNLSESESKLVENHLTICKSCNNDVEVLSVVWNNKKKIEKISPSPYLWQKLDLRLSGSEKSSSPLLIQRLIYTFKFAALIVMVLIAIYIGRQLGTISTSNTSFITNNEEQEYFIKTYRLDTFGPYPQESIGNIFTLAFNDAERGVRK